MQSTVKVKNKVHLLNLIAKQIEYFWN